MAEALLGEPLGLDGTSFAAGSPLSRQSEFAAWIDRYFCVRQRGSTITREIRAGVVTWVTMSYIVVVNPTILSATSEHGGSPIGFHAACSATCLSAALGCCFVGLAANLPFGLAAGMGLNSYVRYGVIGKLGFGPGSALAVCATQGALFAALSALGVTDKMQAILPSGMKSAITVAIGVFQAFVGFQIAGLVVKNDVTLVELGDVSQPRLWLVFTATILVAALIIRKTKGALLIGICFTALAWNALGMPNSLAGDVKAAGSAADAAAGLVSPAELPPPRVDFDAAWTDPQAFFSAVLCMLFVVLFDTAGVQYGIGQQAGLLDGTGGLPGAWLAYLGSALATSVGAFLGTSPVIIHNETAAGVQEGGRTGLCGVVTGLLFLASPPLVPIIELIPPEASAPCLIIVGAMMMGPVKDIDFGDLKLALPAFLTITVTPMTYSISAGIFAGIACYFVLGAVLRFAELGSAAGGQRPLLDVEKEPQSCEAW